MAFDWSDDEIEKLKAMWTAGDSASQIARQLGEGRTRNGVLGKVHRMGLPMREVGMNRIYSSKVSREPRAPKAPRIVGAPQAEEVIETPQEVVAKEPLILEDGSKVTTLTVTDKHCRWPLGHPDEADFHFCGNEPLRHRLYCEAHHRKAYQRLKVYESKQRDHYKHNYDFDGGYHANHRKQGGF